MLKIKDFCETRNISVYRLAQLLPLERSTLHKRAQKQWEVMYVDGVMTFKSPKTGATYTYDVDLEE